MEIIFNQRVGIVNMFHVTKWPPASLETLLDKYFTKFVETLVFATRRFPEKVQHGIVIALSWIPLFFTVILPNLFIFLYSIVIGISVLVLLILISLIIFIPYCVFQYIIRRRSIKETATYLFAAIIILHDVTQKRNISEASAEKCVREVDNIDDIILSRPYLQRIGGRKLRKATADAYKDAATWWREAVSRVMPTNPSIE